MPAFSVRTILLVADPWALPANHVTNDSIDAERLELKVHAFSVQTILLVTDPWALPTNHVTNDSIDPERVELKLHAFSVRTILLGGVKNVATFL